MNSDQDFKNLKGMTWSACNNLLFRVDYKWIKGGTQSLSFQIMKCVDKCGEHHIKK